MKRNSSWILIASIFVIFLLPLIGYTASGCTGIVVEGEDGAAVYGRAMEWGAFDWHAKAIVYPKGKEFRGTTPDRKNGIFWEGKDVRLICYEGEDRHCHRHILKSLVEEKLETL